MLFAGDLDNLRDVNVLLCPGADLDHVVNHFDDRVPVAPGGLDLVAVLQVQVAVHRVLRFFTMIPLSHVIVNKSSVFTPQFLGVGEL